MSVQLSDEYDKRLEERVKAFFFFFLRGREREWWEERQMQGEGESVKQAPVLSVEPNAQLGLMTLKS